LASTSASSVWPQPGPRPQGSGLGLDLGLERLASMVITIITTIDVASEE